MCVCVCVCVCVFVNVCLCVLCMCVMCMCMVCVSVSLCVKGGGYLTECWHLSASMQNSYRSQWLHFEMIEILQWSFSASLIQEIKCPSCTYTVKPQDPWKPFHCSSSSIRSSHNHHLDYSTTTCITHYLCVSMPLAFRPSYWSFRLYVSLWKSLSALI